MVRCWSATSGYFSYITMENDTKKSALKRDARAKPHDWEKVFINRGRKAALKTLLQFMVLGVIGMFIMGYVMFVTWSDDARFRYVGWAIVIWGCVAAGRFGLSPTPPFTISADEYLALEPWETNTLERVRYLHECGVKSVIRWVNVFVWGGLILVIGYYLYVQQLT